MLTQKMDISNSPADTEKSVARIARFPLSFTRFPMCWRTPDGSQVWSPLIEVYTDADKVTVRADMPGVSKQDISLALVGNDLILKGERKAEPAFGSRDYIRCEMSYGKFFRSITLPLEVRKSRVKANYSNGILQIDLPRDNGRNSSTTNIRVTGAGRKRSAGNKDSELVAVK